MLYHIAISLYFIFSFNIRFHSLIPFVSYNVNMWSERCVFTSFFGCFISYETNSFFFFVFFFCFSCCFAILWMNFLCICLCGFYKSHSIWYCPCQLSILVFVYRLFISKATKYESFAHTVCADSVSECQIIIIEKWHSNKCVGFHIFFYNFKITKWNYKQ